MIYLLKSKKILRKFAFLALLLFILIVKFFGPLDLVHAEDAFSIDEFPLPPISNNLLGITLGPDGNVWFTEGSNKIGRITPSGDIIEFPLPNSNSFPYGITAGPDGNVWFTESFRSAVGKITPDGTVAECPYFGAGSLSGIISGPDGNLWFADTGSNKIGRITTSCVATEFAIPFDSSLYSSTSTYNLAAGLDGNVWFAETATNKIGRITSEGIITEFQTPSTDSQIYDIINGPDGNIWYTKTSHYINRIGRITPDGIITEFIVSEQGNIYLNITSGPDGNLWFAEPGANQIGRMTQSGIIAKFQVPTSGSSPLRITSGSDGNIWFTENRANQIGRVNISNSTPTPTPTPTNDSLNVPYFSQNALPWGPSEYDSSQNLGFTNYSMDRWGCAVTSVAMVLKYHNINQFADGTPIDPGSLNLWLKNNNGYITGYGSDGSYSYLNWPIIGKLTKDLFTAGKSSVKLEHRRAYPSIQTTDLLNHDLTIGNDIGKFPDILWVSNSLTSGHFVVAKGLINNTYAINDPEWNYSDLSSFDNSYMQVDRYVPSHTNLSYLTIVVNPNVEILIMDSQGRKTGKYIHNGVLDTYNQIPGSTYSFESPIVNPDVTGIKEYLGTGVNSFLLPEPIEGEYQITISGNNSTNYTLNSSTIQVDGDNQINTTEGIVVPNSENSIVIQYFQTQPSAVSKTVSFQSAINDINELYLLKLITQKSVANSLIRNIQQAQNASLYSNTAKIIQNLDQFTTLLRKERERNITERAYNVLFGDSESLKKSI
ncbi:MAG TPA: C39 family peptidase [Candidatus Saccharimonadales bacterium]|nr:C39 family peptidase [Candidatus Saccharimonadales bacterium]